MRNPLRGSPLRDERVAFRWLIAVLLGAALIILTTELISAKAGMIVLIILVVLVAIPMFRGLVHMLGSPDDDRDDEDPPEGGS